MSFQICKLVVRSFINIIVFRATTFCLVSRPVANRVIGRLIRIDSSREFFSQFSGVLLVYIIMDYWCSYFPTRVGAVAWKVSWKRLDQSFAWVNERLEVQGQSTAWSSVPVGRGELSFVDGSSSFVFSCRIQFRISFRLSDFHNRVWCKSRASRGNSISKTQKWILKRAFSRAIASVDTSCAFAFGSERSSQNRQQAARYHPPVVRLVSCL